MYMYIYHMCTYIYTIQAEEARREARGLREDSKLALAALLQQLADLAGDIQAFAAQILESPLYSDCA
jgi:hypothetical protein